MTKNTLRTIALSIALATGAGGVLQAAHAQTAPAAEASGAAPTTHHGRDGMKAHHRDGKRHHGKFAPMARSPLAVLAQMKSKLSLTDSQQTLWSAAQAQRGELGKAMRAQRLEDSKVLKAQLEAGPLDLRALSARKDEQRSALKPKADAARDAWVVVYESLDAKQKQIVTDAVKKRLERSEQHRGHRGGEAPAKG